MKKLTPKFVLAIEEEVKMMLHAHRDCLRNQGVDTTKVTFDCRDGYYGEAFGIMRTLKICGYGYFGSTNLSAVEENKGYEPRANLRWWFRQLETEVLREEGFGTDNICCYCRKRYGKDAMTKQS